MKKNKLIILLLLIISFSCEKNEVEDVIGEEDKPRVSFSTTSSVINEEGNPQIIINVTMDKPIKTSTTFSAIQVSGDAIEHEDYEVTQGVIPAYSKQGQIIITILEDVTPETTETLEIEVGAFSVPDIYEVIGTDSFNFSIENFVSDDLVMSFDWEKSILYNGVEYGTCSNVDIDIYIADAENFNINNPFINIYPDFTAATGACPEEWTLTFEDYSDGEYILFTDLYDNAFFGINQFDPIPVSATFSRPGVFSQTIEQDTSQAFTTDTGVGTSNGFVAKVIISNGVYTILDLSGTTIANGRLSGGIQKVDRPYIRKQ